MYITNKNGILNTYAIAPITFANHPSADQQQRYTLQRVIAVLLVGMILPPAFAVSYTPISISFLLFMTTQLLFSSVVSASVSI